MTMKKLYLLFILFTIVSFSVSAQERISHENKIDSLFDNKSFLKSDNLESLPDSLVIFNASGERYSKEIFTYDSEGRIIQKVYFLWLSENSSWDEKEKYIYNYDLNNNIILEEKYNWSSTEQVWLTVSKTQYGYDLNGNQILLEYYKGNSSGSDWIIYYRVVSEYGFDGKRISEDVFSDFDTGVFMQTSRTKVTYNPEDNSFYGETEFWDYTLFVWNVKYKWRWVYNTKMNIILEESSTLVNSDMDVWELSKTDFYYDAEDYQTKNITSILIDNNWVEMYKTIATRDTDNNLEIIETYSFVNNNWRQDLYYSIKKDGDGRKVLAESWSFPDSPNRGGTKKIWEYNLEGKEVLMIHYQWGQEINDWVDFHKSEKNYSDNGNLLSIMNYYWYSSEYQYKGHFNYYYYYSSNSSINTDKTSDIKVYSNGNDLVVDSPESEIVSVYSLSGKLITQKVKNIGEIRIEIKHFGSEPVIVRGSSGWTRKIMY